MCHAVLKSTNTTYSSKVEDTSTREQTLLELAWKVDDLSRLSARARNMLVEMAALKEFIEDENNDLVIGNVGRRLSQLHINMTAFVQGISIYIELMCCEMHAFVGLYKHKRTAATHIFVVMISTESRSTKPYALPVQCFSYTGISVPGMRAILNKIITAMVDKKMTVNGIAILL